MREEGEKGAHLRGRVGGLEYGAEYGQQVGAGGECRTGIVRPQPADRHHRQTQGASLAKHRQRERRGAWLGG